MAKGDKLGSGWSTTNLKTGRTEKRQPDKNGKK